MNWNPRKRSKISSVCIKVVGTATAWVHSSCCWHASHRNACPTRTLQIALMKLLPSGRVDVEPTNAAYEELAAQLALPLIECGQASGGRARSSLHATGLI